MLRYILSVVLAFAFAVTAQAGTLQTLHTFKTRQGGVHPVGRLVRDEAGNLYGATYFGGISDSGTVFRLEPDGTHTVLHSFGEPGEGLHPVAGVVRDSMGNLYGVVTDGGARGGGVVFKLAPDGTYTVLHDFDDRGAFPAAGLYIDKHNNIYGTTGHGGGARNAGAVFEINAKNKFRVLYTFRGREDGSWPYGELVKDKDGNLYGTTIYNGPKNYGEVFKLSPDGVKTVLHAFENGDDGSSPMGSLLMDESGNLYGTAYGGGAQRVGTVFKIDTAGKFAVLYTVGLDEGAGPDSGVIMDKTGALYGSLPFGGDKSCGCGAVFKLAPDGSVSVLHTFSGRHDGANPDGLLLDDQGSLYGIAQQGGHKDRGTIFVLQPTK